MGIVNRRDFTRAAATAGLGIGLCKVAAGLGTKNKTRVEGDLAKVNIGGTESFRAHANAVGLQVGCAVIPERLDLAGAGASESSDPYTQAVIAQASILVAENAMKWSSLRPTPTEYNFVPADKLFRFAAAFGQLVRGHNLCWHEQLPAWFGRVATKENAKTLLTEHIQVVASRYAGRMHSWDVVNEAIHIPDGRPDGLRASPWLELIGPDYIEIAFVAAAQADPTAKLTYNDFDIELDTPEQSAKRGQVLMLVKRLHARGIPIHAVGIQSHLQANGPLAGAGLLSFVREIGKMGLEVYITEMDVNTHTLEGGPEVQDAAVAAVYKNYLALLLPEPNVKALLTWGITDAHTWLNESKQPWAIRPDGTRQRPLPLDDQYQPTEAFYAIRSAFDTGRTAVVPDDILIQPKGTGDLFAPFAVPGSPGVPPKD